MTRQRSRLLQELKTRLLVEANHACTICRQSGVQLHHIDGDLANNAEDNLIVLCLAHHDEAEKSKEGRGLSANLTPWALREYKERLKAGLRPTPSQIAPAGSVTANLTDVQNSQVIIAAGDVTVFPPLISDQEPKVSPDQPVREEAKPTIGIITALTKEYATVKAILENTREYAVPGKGAGRRYLLGEVPSANDGRHLLVLTLADMGNNIAAARATLLLEHFPPINSIIMVGIAGGIPHPAKAEDHVRLGDVVVSNQRGVVQYDFGKETISQTIHRHPPRPPSATLLEAVRYLEAAEIEGHRPWLEFIDRICARLGITRPPEETDILASSEDSNVTISHPQDLRRVKDQPRIHLGSIASSNTLLANPVKRDELRDKFGVKAVEMEGSGIADATWNHEVGYLAIRGVCDYCDPNKGDEWQPYAAATAAAYTRARLESMPGSTSGDGPMRNVSSTGQDPSTFSITKCFLPDEGEENGEPSSWRPSQVSLPSIDLEEDALRYLRDSSSQNSATPEVKSRLGAHRKRLQALQSELDHLGSLGQGLLQSTNLGKAALLMEQIEAEKREIERLKRLLWDE